MEGTCLVLDVGSSTIKAGISTTENPGVFRNVVGHVKHTSAFPQHVEGLCDGMFVSNDVDSHKGLLKLAYPMTNGHITDWQGTSKVLTSVYSALGLSAKDHPAIVTEAALTSRPQRAKIAQIMFEEFQHPGVMFASQGLLSLFSSGSTTGVVLDAGDGVIQSVPVFEGYVIREATRRADFGGRDVSNYLRNILRQYGSFFDTSSEVDIVRRIKERHCQVQQGKVDATNKTKFHLPDGGEILLGPEISMATEALFNPALVGQENSGVVNIVSESIRMSDIELRRELYQNIFLAGGSTLHNGFCSRFLTEMTKLTPRDCKVRIVAPGERLFTCWMGGSQIPQLSTFKQMLVKRSEYAEEGERVVHAKTFC